MLPRAKSATQDRYWPDRLGSRTGGGGGSGATAPNGLEKIWVAPSVWPMSIFGLFGLVNTHISVCSVWPIPINTYHCSVWPICLSWVANFILGKGVLQWITGKIPNIFFGQRMSRVVKLIVYE